jgi:hypothetical protein
MSFGNEISIESFTREELHQLKEKALRIRNAVVNEDWIKAFERLATAADILDAFYARVSV